MENVFCSPAEEVDDISFLSGVLLCVIPWFSSLYYYCFKILSKLTDCHLVCQSFVSVSYKTLPIPNIHFKGMDKLSGISTLSPWSRSNKNSQFDYFWAAVPNPASRSRNQNSWAECWGTFSNVCKNISPGSLRQSSMKNVTAEECKVLNRC